MFERLLSAKPEGTSILIIDSGTGSGRDLLLSYVRHRRRQGLCVTLHPGGWQSPLDPADSPETLDSPPDGSPPPAARWQTAGELGRALERVMPPAGGPAAVLAVQEGSCLLYWLGPAAICRIMKRGADRGHQVVLTVSEPALEESWLAQLRHYATHTLTVAGVDRDLTVTGTYRFRAGKVETATERVCLSPDLTISRVAPARPAAVTPAAPLPPPSAPLAPGLTTFSLSLTEAERQSRSRLVLPYLRPEQGGGDSAPGTGQIFYQPDAADDWDEEDPDDDLDI